MPLVVVDAPRLPGHAYVRIEDRLGARLAAEHLIGTRPPALRDRAARRRAARAAQGYRDAFDAAGLDWEAVPTSRQSARSTAMSGRRP